MQAKDVKLFDVKGFVVNPTSKKKGSRLYKQILKPAKGLKGKAFLISPHKVKNLSSYLT